MKTTTFYIMGSMLTLLIASLATYWVNPVSADELNLSLDSKPWTESRHRWWCSRGHFFLSTEDKKEIKEQMIDFRDQKKGIMHDEDLDDDEKISKLIELHEQKFDIMKQRVLDSEHLSEEWKDKFLEKMEEKYELIEDHIRERIENWERIGQRKWWKSRWWENWKRGKWYWRTTEL